jgi:hypothetical protein
MIFRTGPILFRSPQWISDPGKSIHNAFVQGNYLFIAYYTDGLRILDISDPSIPIEVGFYQTYQGSTSVMFAGAWGVYPYYPSGKLVVSDMNTGLYALTFDRKKGGRITGSVRDAVTLQNISGATVTVQQMGRTYTTNGSGRFLYGSAEGKHIVTFAKSGYITRHDTVTTRPGMLDSIIVTLTPSAASGIERIAEIPAHFSLAQNYPNPFNPATTIEFTLSDQQFTTLTVFNALGQDVSTLVRQVLNAGHYRTNVQFRIPSERTLLLYAHFGSTFSRLNEWS